MFFRRSFANQLKEANKVFTKTIKSLETISSGINTEVNKNNIKIQKIGDKNLNRHKTRLTRSVLLFNND